MTRRQQKRSVQVWSPTFIDLLIEQKFLVISARLKHFDTRFFSFADLANLAEIRVKVKLVWASSNFSYAGVMHLCLHALVSAHECVRYLYLYK